MDKVIQKQQVFQSNDVRNAFTHFNAVSARESYGEIVRDETCLRAARRWPLLAEIQSLVAHEAA